MKNNGRPPLLSALCILSFAGNGIAFLVYLFAAVNNREAVDFIIKRSSSHDPSKYTPVYFLIFVMLYAISFSGVLKMWKLKKTGFRFYITSQTAILFLPVFWSGKEAFSPVALIFTILFAGLYATRLKDMTN